jgi:hypothetical protein
MGDRTGLLAAFSLCIHRLIVRPRSVPTEEEQDDDDEEEEEEEEFFNHGKNDELVWSGQRGNL